MEVEDEAVVISDGAEDESPPLAAEEPVIIVKKKGRKKKKVIEEQFHPLPEEVAASYATEIVPEIEIAYQILQSIMRMSKIDPFLEKPNENLFGMSTYYKIVKKPMWLTEVQRKLFAHEYDDIGKFVADIRLILENCYRYWGPTHKFSKKALDIEHKLEQRLSTLPQVLQDKCLDSELCANEVVIKVEKPYDDDNPDAVNPESVNELPPPAPAKKGFESKILNKLLESEEPDELTEDAEEQAKKEAEMQQWEREHLVNDALKEQINSLWQLAEIGSFLKLTHEEFRVEEITQYEIERMLLMPKESTTLANLMTSMLSPQVHRAQLDVKPVMPYAIWSSRLKKKMDSWFSVLYSTCDQIETFSTIGIEPQFWAAVGVLNPMEEKMFHEIPFFQRVWIFKSLCNNLMHIDKPIQDIIADPANAKEIKPIRICSCKQGFSYFRIPFFREVRIYKQARLPDKVYEAEDFDGLMENIFDSTTVNSFNDSDNVPETLPSRGSFLLIADSIDGLVTLIEKNKNQNRLILTENLSKQLKLVKKERRSTDGLAALYSQWHDYHSRSEEYFSNMLNLWLTYEKPPRDYGNAINDNQSEENGEVLGKRRIKPNINFDFSSLRSTDSEERSDDSDSSNVSDWECDYMHKKKKKVERKKKSKHSLSASRSESSEDEPKLDDSAFEIEEVKLKQEIIDPNPSVLNLNDVGNDSNIDIKPVIKQEEIVPFQLEPIVNSVSYNLIQPVRTTTANSVSHVPDVDIKKEKDDVICISSDEETETKTVSRLPTVAKNGMQPPKMGAQPAVVLAPVRPPPVRARSIPQPISVPQPKTVPHVPQPIPMPHPILVRILSPQRSSTIASPGKAPVPKPIPIPAPIPRQMPLPIPEPAMPQPIREPPMPAHFGSQGWTSPRSTVPSPRSRAPLTPRHRSPVSPMTSPMARTPSPRFSPTSSPVRPVRPVRNLFSDVPTVEGVLEIGQKPDGSYGYHVRLPDGGVINMSRTEIDDIRRKNNGVLPVKIEVPLMKNKKF